MGWGVLPWGAVFRVLVVARCVGASASCSPGSSGCLVPALSGGFSHAWPLGRSLSFVRSCDLKVLATLTLRAVPQVLASTTAPPPPAGLRLLLEPPDRLRRWNTRDQPRVQQK